MLLLGIRSYLKSALRYKFLNLDVTRQLYISMSRSLRIRNYFSKTDVFCEQNSLENTALVSFRVSVGRADTEETTQWTGKHSSLCRPMHRICKSFRNKWLTSHPITYIKIGDFCRRLSSLSRQRVTTYRCCGENG
jgi:hypothetical protein